MLTGSQVEAALSDGHLVFTADYDTVHRAGYQQSHHLYTGDRKGVPQNRVMRLCNAIANDIYQQFSSSYLGVINNNETGRNLFKSAVVSYLLTLQGQGSDPEFFCR